MTLYEVIRRPLVTEKGVDEERYRAHTVLRSGAEANKTQVKRRSRSCSR